MQRGEIGRYEISSTGKRRDRLFVYDRYLAILNEGTEAI